jgi:hypothetical protein
MRPYSAVLLVGVMMLGLSCGALAAQCNVSDINGRWSMYIAGDDGFWTECRFVVRANRNASGRCRSLGIPWTSLTTTLTVSRSCAIGGQGFLSNVIGTLQGEGQAGAGIVFLAPGTPFNSGGFNFSLVRRP